MPIRIVRTVAVGTIATLGLAAVAFIPAAYASTGKQAAAPHLAILTEPVAPSRKAA